MREIVDEPTPIDDALRAGGIDSSQPVVDDGPLYRVMADSKIPVSKHLGKLWQSRMQQSKASRGDIESCWREAIRYYENDQMGHRTEGQDEQGGNKRYMRALGKKWSETENIVFSNAVTMLPMLYAKNPDCEITTTDTGEDGTKEKWAVCLEAVVDKILTMKEAPGLNVKPKARRAVLTAMLTNCAWIELGWTQKEFSSEAALKTLSDLSVEYAEAKDRKTIKELEGKITALEQSIDILSPSGPYAKIISPFRMFYDPLAVEPDFSDATWMAKFDFLPTAFINATYGMDKDGKTVSVYEPTHVLKAGITETDDDTSFSIFDKTTTNMSAYGYGDTKAFASAQMTKVWYVWDKITRRVLLFSDCNWEWPLWVWDDPLKILRFFPFFRLWFHETIEGSQPKGEVTYILDQQDAINDIHSTVAQAREWSKNNIFYNADVVSEGDVTAVLSGPNGTAKPVKNLPEGTKLADHIFSFEPPALKTPELFDTDKLLAAINRIVGINDAQRGAQFKTNTTNDAIDFYQKNVDIRVDEKIDLIEDWLGDFMWSLAQLLARYWTVEDVSALVGAKIGADWKQIEDPAEFRGKANVRVVGGSTDKPTSRMKKEQALKMAQLFGQFASGVPAMAMLAIKVLSRAFDDLDVTPEDWKMLAESMSQTAQKAGSGPGGQQGQAPAGAEQQGQQTPSPEQADAVKQLIAGLPPEGKQRLQELVQHGVSPTDALKQVTHDHPPQQA